MTKLTREPSNDEKLAIYGLFKQGTVGDCNIGKFILLMYVYYMRCKICLHSFCSFLVDFFLFTLMSKVTQGYDIMLVSLFFHASQMPVYFF